MLLLIGHQDLWEEEGTLCKWIVKGKQGLLLQKNKDFEKIKHSSAPCPPEKKLYHL